MLNLRASAYPLISHWFTHAGTYNPRLHDRRIITKSTSVTLASNAISYKGMLTLASYILYKTDYRCSTVLRLWFTWSSVYLSSIQRFHNKWLFIWPSVFFIISSKCCNTCTLQLLRFSGNTHTDTHTGYYNPTHSLRLIMLSLD